eukprot:scaffold134_cov409-Pavlova_lutheri.AAC.1
MTRMEELKEELEALKLQLTLQGEELERMRDNPSSFSQGGTVTHSTLPPPSHHGSVETITKPKTFSFHNVGEEVLSEMFEAWWSSVSRWYGRRKARIPDLEEAECVVDLLDMVQGSKCAVLNSLYEKGTLPRELEAFKKLLIQIYRIRPSAEAAYKEFEKAYQKRDMSVRHYLLHLEELQRKVNLDDGKLIPQISNDMVLLKLRSSVWVGIRDQLRAKLEVDRLDGNEKALETLEDWLELLEYCEERHAREKEARERESQRYVRNSKAVHQKIERSSAAVAVPTLEHRITLEQKSFRAEWKGKRPTPHAIELCKQLGLCLIFRCLSPDHVANDCPFKNRSLGTGNGQAPGNGIPRRAVNPLEHRPFKEEGSAVKPANLAAIQLRSQDDTVSEDSKYHVDYCRDRSTFQRSDLTTGVGEHSSTIARSQVVVNLAQIGSQVFLRPAYVQGKELRALWDTGAGRSYVHKEFQNLGKIISRSHYVRSVFANGQTHTTNELLQLSVLLGPGDQPTEKGIEVKVKVIPMDLPESYDLIFGCDVMSQLQASLNLDRNTIQLTHRNQTVTLVEAKFKIGETSPVNGLASASVSTAEQHAHHPVSFSTMEEEFGPFKTALFVATTTGLATLNYAEPEEAMRQDWGILPGPIICVPPLRLLPQVTQKLQSTAPLSLVLLAPFMPSSPWFQELRPFIQKGRVIPSADTTYGYEAATQASSATTCPMVALQINCHASAEPTTLSAIQESRPTITRTTIESLQLPETLDPAQQKQLKDLLGRYMHLMQPPGDNEPPPAPSEFDHRIVLTEGGTQRVQTRPIRLAADQTIELQKRFEHRCNRGIMWKAASDSRTCRSAVFM